MISIYAQDININWWI